MYIFLDIDGVLVKEDDPKATKVEIEIDPDEDFVKFDPTCLHEFETVVRQSENCQIVISSSWREVFSLKTIKSLFSADIAEKVIGVTPIATRPVKYYRYQEIIWYLKSNKLTHAEWVAVDDIAEHFPKDAPLVITNPFTGFDRGAAEQLQTYLTTSHHSASVNEPNLILAEGTVAVITAEGQFFVKPDKKTAERVTEDGSVLEKAMFLTVKSGKIYWTLDN